MNSSLTFLARLPLEPIFIGGYRRGDAPKSNLEPAAGDTATLHTADDSLQIKIATATGRTYMGEILATTNRHTYEPRELQGSAFAEFTYAEIVAFTSPARSGRSET